MKSRELRAKSAEELHEELNSLTKAKFGLRMQIATQQTTNWSQNRKLRRDIARVKTVIREEAMRK